MEDNATVIVASFQLTKSLPNQSQLIISGHFYNKDDPAAINARLDEWVDRAQRQMDRAAIDMLESQKRGQLDNLSRIKERYALLVDKVQAGKKLKTQEMNEHQNGQTSVDAALATIKKIDEGIAELTNKVALQK